MGELDEYHSFAIFPALNVARVGNSKEYYVGSEIPGVYVGKGDSSFKFKDNDGLIKPQAARFRIYGYKENGENLGEINLSDTKFKGKVKIEWSVVLGNKKAAHQGFDGMYQDHKSVRNAGWPYNRSTLEAISKRTLASDRIGKANNFEDFNARVYRKNLDDDEKKYPNDGPILDLGKMIIEEEGSLLIIGGRGKSGSIKDTLITDYANNDYWYDDTSDGSVDATVTIIDGNRSLENGAGSSWVLVAPPKYAPGIPNIVSLYQTILETQHPVKTESDNPVIDPVIPDPDSGVNYYRDIRPIFEAICKNAWVNPKGFMGHGPDKPGYFLDSELEKKLNNPLVDGEDKHKDLRKSILSRVRIPYDPNDPDGPNSPATKFERNGQAYDYFMPPLSGDDGDVIPGDPNTYLTLTRGQYFLLQKWANGDFVKGDEPQYDFKYKFDSSDSRRQPIYSNDGGTNYYSFQEVFQEIYSSVPVSQQVKFLNKAALEWCVGGAFYPGIEMTYLAYDKNTFKDYVKNKSEFDFRINSDVIEPGDINAYMALPWQADFNECETNWWPAQRPDTTISEAEMLREVGEMKKELEKIIKITKDVNQKIQRIIGKMEEMMKTKQINWTTMTEIYTAMTIIKDETNEREIKEKMTELIKQTENMINMDYTTLMRYTVEWTRGFRNNEPNQGSKWGDMDMVRVWNRLGFIVEKQFPNDNSALKSAFVEIERGDIYELSSKDIRPNFYTLDNLRSLLNIALQIELSTIPPYLYALYSIKPKTTNIGNIADMIKYKIRHVAAEEMLHVSLVANLIAAVGSENKPEYKLLFYSPEMIPFYPNPLPHFQQGLLMVHLSKADEKNLDTFIKIEEPYTLPSTPPPITLPGTPPGKIPRLPELPINVNSIAELYQLIKKFFKNTSGIQYETKFQLEPGMGYAPSTSTGNDGLIVVKKLDDAERAIDLIIDQGEGKPAHADMTITTATINGKIRGETRNVNHVLKIEGIIEGDVNGFVTKANVKGKLGKIKGRIEKARIQGEYDKNEKKIINGKIIEGIIKGVTEFPSESQTIKQIIERIIEGSDEDKFEVNDFESIEGTKFENSINVTINNANIEEYSHYNTFKICKLYVENARESEYELWPVIEDPNLSSYTDPKIIATATAFNAAYSYLMLLLQNAWRTDNKEKEKKELVIGGMPALMHGVLKPIATFLAETSISVDTNAGATFGYYEFAVKPSVKQQLIAAVQEASKAFPENDKLKAVTNVVTSLPDISLKD